MPNSRKDHAARDSAHTLLTLILVVILASMSLKAFSSPLQAITNDSEVTALVNFSLDADQLLNSKKKVSPQRSSAPTAQLLQQNLSLNRLPAGLPLGGIKRITSLFGARLHPIEHLVKLHTGIDLATQPGTPVMSTGGGVVVKVDDEGASGYGKYIEVRHSLGLSSIYGHLQRSNVSVGDKVTAQQVIGFSGDSGSSTGPHLHYEVRYRDKPIDPLAFIKWANAKRDNVLVGDQLPPWAAKSS